MKAALLVLAMSLAGLLAPSTFQFGQRGQTRPAQAAQQDSANAEECKCSIAITVKNTSTGEPISDVHVSVTPFAITGGAGPRGFRGRGSAADNTVTATTDNGGHAVFRDLAEGNYSIRVQLDGYFVLLNGSYQAQGTTDTSVAPPPRQPEQQVTFSMVRGAIVSGRIMDGNGQSISAVQVAAYQVKFQNGQRVLTQADPLVQSDDRGEYRLFWLTPGRYYIRTIGNRQGARGNTGAFPIAFYYPGTMDPTTSYPIQVREGTSLADIDITVQSIPAVTISGTVINAIPGEQIGLQGQLNRSVTAFYLARRNTGFLEAPILIQNGASSATRGPETLFEIRGVPPGSYDLYALFNDATATAPGGIYGSRTPIEVGAENIAGIQSVIRPGAALKGKVTVSDSVSVPTRGGTFQQVTPSTFRVQMRAKENIPTQLLRPLLQPIAPDTDGVFTLSNLIDGQYSISGVNFLPSNAYISDIRLDSRSVFDDAVITIVKDSQSTLDIIVSRGGGTIEGTVLDAQRNPLAAVRVILIPDLPRRQNAMLYKYVDSNTKGVFNLNSVAPGRYKLFAWEEVPPGAEQDPDFIRDYDLLGTSVNVSAGIPLTGIRVTQIPKR